MPGAYADHEMPTMVPTVTIEGSAWQTRSSNRLCSENRTRNG